MRRELKPIKGDGEIGDEARQAMKEERERILRSARHNMQFATRRATCNAACNMQRGMQHAMRGQRERFLRSARAPTHTPLCTPPGWHWLRCTSAGARAMVALPQ